MLASGERELFLHAEHMLFPSESYIAPPTLFCLLSKLKDPSRITDAIL